MFSEMKRLNMMTTQKKRQTTNRRVTSYEQRYVKVTSYNVPYDAVRDTYCSTGTSYEHPALLLTARSWVYVRRMERMKRM